MLLVGGGFALGGQGPLRGDDEAMPQGLALPTADTCLTLIAAESDDQAIACRASGSSIKEPGTIDGQTPRAADRTDDHETDRIADRTDQTDQKDQISDQSQDDGSETDQTSPDDTDPTSPDTPDTPDTPTDPQPPQRPLPPQPPVPPQPPEPPVPPQPAPLGFTGINQNTTINLLGIRVLSSYTLTLSGEPGQTGAVWYGSTRAGTVTFDGAGRASITLGGSLVNLGLRNPLIRAAYSDGSGEIQAYRDSI